MTRAAEAGLAVRLAPAAGERVLWIHGYTMDSSTWAELWRALPGLHHVGVDLPGHGRSPAAPPGEELPELARSLGRLALAHGARHVVALSFGTMVALQAAIELPGAFATVVLGAPALAGGPHDPAVGARYAALGRLHVQRGAGPHLAELWTRPPAKVFDAARERPQLWEPLREVVFRHAWSELTDGSMRRMTAHVQAPEQLGAIRSAVLVIVGEHEMPAFRRCADEIERAVPRCRRTELAGAGHLCLLEQPQRAAALIGAHVAAHSALRP